ncbi:MAG: SMC-Scp complex subunit ScpB, partial [Caldithrix sp.]|nr:SMC-Scp complex subunit ScpB [Caldithrix sp.]
MTDIVKRQIIEALIFASDDPLPAKKIKELVDPQLTIKEVRNTINEVNKIYEEIHSPLQVIEIAGGYQIVTRKQYADWINKLYQSRTQQRLTQKGLETLAIIAYKQPLTKQEIEQIRGVNSDGVIRTLIERNLI